MSDTKPPSSLPQSQQPPSDSQDPSSDATVVPKLEPDSDATALDTSIEQEAVMAGPNDNPSAAGADTGAGAASRAGAVDEQIGNPVQAPTSVDAAATSKKETSLREFLGKMDDYAPIVRSPFPCSSSTEYKDISTNVYTEGIDPRRRNRPLPHPRRPPTTGPRTEPNTPTSGATPRSCNTKIHRGYCSGLVPVCTDSGLKFLVRE
ncbi:hypothetical protein BDW71DRAFT_169775 [Aspergillus fruticulosus]